MGYWKLFILSWSLVTFGLKAMLYRLLLRIRVARLGLRVAGGLNFGEPRQARGRAAFFVLCRESAETFWTVCATSIR